MKVMKQSELQIYTDIPENTNGTNNIRKYYKT